MVGRAICVEQIEGRRKRGHVSSHIAETFQPRPLEAVLRYGISYLFDGKIWKLELIAVGVDQLLFRRLVEVLDRSERRERSRRRRSHWRIIRRPSC